MSRIRDFVVQVEVSEEFLREYPEKAKAWARDLINERAAGPLTGPRGGRYEPVNLPHSFRAGPSDDFARPVRTFIARVAARYVRPSR